MWELHHQDGVARPAVLAGERRLRVFPVSLRQSTARLEPAHLAVVTFRMLRSHIMLGRIRWGYLAPIASYAMILSVLIAPAGARLSRS